MMLLAPLISGYFLGSIPFGLILTRAAGLGDIRAIGSGSIGATNVLRTGRSSLAAATLLLDAAKGFLAVLLGAHLGGETGALLSGLAAVLGHIFPPWLNFRGGKGVATGLGVLLGADWRVALLAGAIWLIVARLSRISSAAALCACAAAPLLALALDGPPLAAMALVVALLIIARHHANIRRLRAGTEPRIGQKT